MSKNPTPMMTIKYSLPVNAQPKRVLAAVQYYRPILTDVWNIVEKQIR